MKNRTSGTHSPQWPNVRHTLSHVVLTGICLTTLALPALAANFPGVGTYAALKNTAHGYYWAGPGSVGLKGHALQQASNPARTWKIQQAPDNGHGAGFYNIINVTDNRCLTVGDGVYECGATRSASSNCNAGYLSEIQDTATMPGAPCNYADDHAQWQIIDNGTGVDFKTNGYVKNFGASAGGVPNSSNFCVSETDLIGSTDLWVRNAGAGCGSSASKITFGAFTPAATLGHIRFEYDPAYALLCKPQPFTIKACTEVASAVGTANPTCTPYTAGTTFTPTATSTTVGATLTWSPAGALAIGATGILSGVTLGNTDDTAPVTLGLASGTLECYDSSQSKVVSCTSALTYHVCTFDAVEHGAAWGTRLYTKLAGVNFPNSGIDLMMGFNGAINADYNNTPTVELVDDTSGTACSDRTALAGITFAPSVTKFTSGNLTLGVVSTKAAAKVRVRIKDSAYPPGYACSTDSFTIRPSGLALSSDSGVVVAGNQSGGHSPGFKMYAQAQNKIPADISGYTGMPVLDPGTTINDSNSLAINFAVLVPQTASDIATLSWAGSTNVTPAVSGFAAAATATGKATGTFYYNDFGPLTLPVYAVVDKTFVGPGTSNTATSNDQFNADCLTDATNGYSNTEIANASYVGAKYGCFFRSQNATVTTPRFRVDHYEVNNKMTPGCAVATSFSYMGQPIAAQLDVTAWNADSAKMTRLLSTTPGRPTVVVASTPIDLTLTPPGALSGASGTSGLPMTAAPTWPSATPGGKASGNNATCTAASCAYIRPATATAPANVTVTVSISDADTPPPNINSLNGNPQSPWLSSAIATANFRFGMLKLDNAYGSELLPLHVPVRALYWNGSQWIMNSDDSCTSIARANIGISNYKPAANLSSTNVIIESPVPITPMTLSAGTASIKFTAPGLGSTGSADVAINLGTGIADVACTSRPPPATTGAGMGWLRGAWCTSTYDRDPSSRITFGTAKSPYLYMREKY